MKIAIFSDIHGNLPAFELMLKDAGEVDQYISLGDVVNYGPWSNECVQLLMSLDNCIKLMGNHDQYFIRKKYNGSNIIAKTSFEFCIQTFHENLALKTFQKEHRLDRYSLLHTINNNYIYPDSRVDLNNNYIIGHSHHQFKLKFNKFMLYNTGSVGQNRKHINVIDYIMYYAEEEKIEMRNIIYNVEQVINEMKIKKFPDICIDYYIKKKRIKTAL